jgi:hypothetical protein
LWGTVVLDIFVNQDILLVQVSSAYRCISIGHAVVAGEPGGSAFRAPEVFPVDTQEVIPNVTLVTEVEPLSACPPSVAFTAYFARFLDVSVTVRRFERQGNSFSASIGSVILTPFVG